MENEEIISEDLETVEATSDVETPEVKEPEQLTLSLDQALEKAMEKHSPERVEESKPKTALPVQDGIVTPVKEEGKLIDPISGRELEPIKPPASLTPALREKWQDVDPRFQKFWVDRERDMQTKLNETAEDRKIAKGFRDIAQPYEPMLRQFGITAEQHTKELFNLSHSLNTGSPQQKAQIIYNLINHFKPDPQTLTELFSGQAPQPQQPQVNVQEEVQRIIAQREQEAAEARNEQVINEFASNPEHEFFDDVKVQMGRIIDAGLVDGRTETEILKNAYNLACNHHPEIAEILKSRQAPVQQVNTPTPVKSVKASLGTSNPQPKQPKKMTLDEAVEMAFRSHGL